jgi:XRE family transcriptional regulator, regulator of sulfur utilization
MKMLNLVSFKEIGGAFRQMRESAGLTLREASERSRLSVSYISEVERGRTMPSLDTIARLAAVYGYEARAALAKAQPK